MKRPYRYFLLVVLMTLAPGALRANGWPGIGRRLMRQAYRMGGVCRHAAAMVYNAAREAGYPVAVVLHDTPDDPKRYGPGVNVLHVNPYVFLPDPANPMGGKWYGFEECCGGRASGSRSSHVFRTDPSWWGRVYLPGYRPRTKYLGLIPAKEIAVWTKEVEAIRDRYSIDYEPLSYPELRDLARRIREELK